MNKKKIHLQFFRNTTIIISIIFFIQFIVQVFSFDHLYLFYRLQDFKDPYKHFTYELDNSKNYEDIINSINSFSLKTDTYNTTLNDESIIQEESFMKLDITTTTGLYEILTLPFVKEEITNQTVAIQGFKNETTNQIIATYIKVGEKTVIGEHVSNYNNYFNFTLIDHYDFSNLYQTNGTISNYQLPNENISLKNNNILCELLQLPYLNNDKIKFFNDNSQYYLSNQDIIFIHQSNSDQKVITMIPLDYYYETYSFITIINGILLFVLFVLTILLSYINANRITKPIRLLNTFSTNYSYLNIKENLSLNSNNELQSITDSFYNLSHSIGDYERRITQLNKKIYELLKNELHNETIRENLFKNLSDQLYEPFEKINIHTQLLLKEKHNFTNIKHLDLIEKETNNCRKIINDLIYINKIKENIYKKNYEPLDMKLLIENVLRDIDHIITRSKIILQLNLQPNFVHGDKSKLSLAFKYLILTALLYAKENNFIQITLKEYNNKIFLKIENAHTDIPDDKLKLMFQPFQVMDKIVQDETDTTILSMYIVKLILEQHEADFGVYNGKNGVVYFFKMKKFDINQLM